MDPDPASGNALVSLTLELKVKPELVHWLDELQRQFGLRSREAVVSRLLESLAGDAQST